MIYTMITKILISGRYSPVAEPGFLKGRVHHQPREGGANVLKIILLKLHENERHWAGGGGGGGHIPNSFHK